MIKNEKKIKFNELMKFLNYNFNDITLLQEALTRQSAITANHPSAAKRNYSKLEYFGNIVIDMIISDLIYEIMINKKVEEFIQLKSFFLKNEILGKFGSEKNLGQYLILGKAEDNGTIKNNKNVLAEVIKALVAAIFLDNDRNYLKTKNVVLAILKDVILSEKMLLKYALDLNQYFKNLQVTPLDFDEDSDVIHLESPNNSNLISVTNISQNNDNSSNFNINYIFEPINNNINNFTFVNISHPFINEDSELTANYDIMKIKEILILNNEELIESKLNNFIINLTFKNNFLDHEFISLHFSNILVELMYNFENSTNIIIKLLKNKITQYYLDFNVKCHFISSRLLLIIINLNNEQKDKNLRLFTILHNGFCEFFKRNYNKSKEYFIGILSNLDSENFDLKFYCLIYLCEVAFIEKDFANFNNYYQILNNFPPEFMLKDIVKMVKFKKISVQREIINNMNSSNLNIENYFYFINTLDEDHKKLKIINNDMIEMKILNLKLKNNFNSFEVYNLEKELEDKYIYNSPLLIKIYEFQLEGINYYNKIDEEKYNYLIKLIKVIFFNFTFNSQIFKEYFKMYNDIIDKYSNLF